MLVEHEAVAKLQAADALVGGEADAGEAQLRRREDALRAAGARGVLEYWEQDFPALQDTEG